MARIPVKASPALIGAAIGGVAFILLGLLLKPIWAVLGIYGGVTLLAYILGATTIGNNAGEFFRGLLIGVNAGMNWTVGAIVYPAILGPATGHIVAIVVAAIPFLATFGIISKSVVYQGFLGYLNWFLPMSWLIVATGLLFLILGALGALIGLAGVQFFKVERLALEWRTGTLFLRGGWISNLNPIDTAFNMGNFAFVDTKYAGMAMDHEAGHTLNLAAFGSLFHIIGAIDENALRGENAFSECLAESHVAGSARPVLEMWA